MLVKGLERVFIVAYVLILIGTAGVLFLQEPPDVPRYWGFIYLTVSLAPFAAWGWVHRQLASSPITSTAFGLLALAVWSAGARSGRVEDALILIPILAAVVWAIRGFSRKETQDGSV